MVGDMPLLTRLSRQLKDHNFARIDQTKRAPERPARNLGQFSGTDDPQLRPVIELRSHGSAGIDDEHLVGYAAAGNQKIPASRIIRVEEGDGSDLVNSGTCYVN